MLIHLKKIKSNVLKRCSRVQDPSEQPFHEIIRVMEATTVNIFLNLDVHFRYKNDK